MIRKSAVWLSDVFCKRGWIELDSYDWCVYALEKRLGLLLLVVFLSLWMIISRLYIETMAFLVPLYLLRRRIGGWHAKSEVVCFSLSAGSAILSSSLLGRALSVLPPLFLLTLDAITMLFAIFLQPEYPSQLYFSEGEKAENGRIKNDLLFHLFLIQCFSLVSLDNRFLAHSFCAVFICVVSVLIQKQKGGVKNEQN